MLDLPDIRQRKDYDCGHAAVETVTRYFGLPRPPDLSNAVDGTAPETVEALLWRAGLRLAAGHLTAADLKHFTNRGSPVVCPVTTPAGGHWVVVRGVSRMTVYYQDPEVGPTQRIAKSWNTLWTDTTRSGRVYSQWGIVCHAPTATTS